MTTSLLIAILMTFSTMYPDMRIEWRGEFVAPSQIIHELKTMEDQENKPVEEQVEESTDTSTDEAAPAEDSEEEEKPLMEGARNA